VPHSAERDQPGLEEHRTVLPGPGVAELRHVRLTIRHVDLEPADRQQPPANTNEPLAVPRGRQHVTSDRPEAPLKQLGQTPLVPAVSGPSGSR
jgi:hypothetical protein